MYTLHNISMKVLVSKCQIVSTKYLTNNQSKQNSTKHFIFLRLFLNTKFKIE